MYNDVYQTEVDVREEQRRRIAYFFFAISMIVSVAICATIVFMVMTPDQGRRMIGQESDFAIGEVEDVAVKRLDLTELLPTKPNWSEDIIYVIKQPDSSYRAFLGLDPQSGCLVKWHDDTDEFVDDQCSQTIYSATGRNQTQAASLSGQPAHLIEVPVEIQEGDVYILDRRLVRDRQ